MFLCRQIKRGKTLDLAVKKNWRGKKPSGVWTKAKFSYVGISYKRQSQAQLTKDYETYRSVIATTACWFEQETSRNQPQKPQKVILTKQPEDKIKSSWRKRHTYMHGVVFNRTHKKNSTDKMREANDRNIPSTTKLVEFATARKDDKSNLSIT